MPSALWTVRPVLFDTFTAAVPDTRVFDGPRPRGEQPKEFLLVGASSMEDNGSPALRAEQSPSTLGDGTWRDELGEIDCTAVAWKGDGDMAAIRVGAKRIVDNCESALNADPTLGGLTLLNNFVAEVVGYDVREARTDAGPFVEAIFTVSYRALLTGTSSVSAD